MRKIRACSLPDSSLYKPFSHERLFGLLHALVLVVTTLCKLGISHKFVGPKDKDENHPFLTLSATLFVNELPGLPEIQQLHHASVVLVAALVIAAFWHPRKELSASMDEWG